MRYIKVALGILGLAGMLMAADPFVGTWKMDAAKTKYKKGSPPKEQTIAITESGEDLDINVTGTAADGSAVKSHFTVPAKGGTGKISESTYEGVSAKRISDKERETTFLKGGKTVYTVRSKMSADGKSYTSTSKGLNIQGQTVEGTMVNVKQ